MKATIKPFTASGEVFAPPSKSFAHRYIVSAFLSGKKCVIENVGDSDDVKSTVGAVKSLGGELDYDGDTVTFYGRHNVKKATVDCGESGSTLRFLLPVACALNVSATFTGKGRLLDRPINAIRETLESQGAKIDGYTTSGGLKCGKYYLDASQSSQYVSGLLFALSVLDGESEIILCGKNVSAGYVDATVSVLKKFGVKVEKTDTGYKVTGGYKGLEKAVVEGDWSGAAFMLSIGVLCGKVTVKNIAYPSLQPDCKIVKILQDFGGKITVEGDRVTAEKGELKGGNRIYCEDCPDLAQVVCAVAAFCNGKTVVSGIERLKIKESDRIQAILKMLETANVCAKYSTDKIEITGGKVSGGDFDGGLDHRTVMSSAVLACAGNGVSTVSGAEACAKSYPQFFKHLTYLGGKENVSF